MSKRSMLELFEKNGRGRSCLAVALPERLHSQTGSLLPWTIQQTAQYKNPDQRGW